MAPGAPRMRHYGLDGASVRAADASAEPQLPVSWLQQRKDPPAAGPLDGLLPCSGSASLRFLTVRRSHGAASTIVRDFPQAAPLRGPVEHTVCSNIDKSGGESRHTKASCRGSRTSSAPSHTNPSASARFRSSRFCGITAPGRRQPQTVDLLLPRGPCGTAKTPDS